jgi:transposase-like protein
MTDQERHARARLVAQWRESGKSAREFARDHGVTPWILYYWREKLAAFRDRTQPARSELASLVPVQVVSDDAPLTGGELEVILATGDRLRVRANVTTDTLRRVVDVLRAGC